MPANLEELYKLYGPKPSESPPLESPAVTLPVEELPAEPSPIQETPIQETPTEEPTQEHEQHVITETSEVITELKTQEQDDSEYYYICGEYFHRDSPVIRKLLEQIKIDSESEQQMTDAERIEQLEPNELVRLAYNPELAKEFGISDIGMHIALFNQEFIRISKMDDERIKERIKILRDFIRVHETLIQIDLRELVCRRDGDIRREIKKSDDEYKKSDEYKKLKAKIKAEDFKKKQDKKKKDSWEAQKENIVKSLMMGGKTREQAIAKIEESEKD